MFLYGLVLWTDLRKGLYVQGFEVFAYDSPEVTDR